MVFSLQFKLCSLCVLVLTSKHIKTKNKNKWEKPNADEGPRKGRSQRTPWDPSLFPSLPCILKAAHCPTSHRVTAKDYYHQERMTARMTENQKEGFCLFDCLWDLKKDMETQAGLCPCRCVNAGCLGSVFPRLAELPGERVGESPLRVPTLTVGVTVLSLTGGLCLSIQNQRLRRW